MTEFVQTAQYFESKSLFHLVICDFSVSFSSGLYKTHQRGENQSALIMCVIITSFCFFQDELLQKNTFDPLAQHRDWCPWISAGKENVDTGILLGEDVASHQQGWKVALDLLLPIKNSNSTESSPTQASRVSVHVEDTLTHVVYF